MIKKTFIALLCLIPLSVFANDSLKIKNVTESIKARMKDPDSTQFRNLRVVTNLLGNKAVCGEVNSKNSYGGYNGFKPFADTQEGFILLDDNGVASFIYERRYDLSGCNGKEKENSERTLQTHRENLAKNPQIYQDYCTIAYGFYADVLRNNTSKEIAIEKTMIEYKDKKLELLNPNLEDARNKLLFGFSQVQTIPVAVKEIKKNSKSFENQYMKDCIRLLKANQPI